MVNCKHVLEKPKIEDIYEFCEYGGPDYVMVRMKCTRCGMLGRAAATLEWDTAMFDEEIDWVEKIEFE